MPLPIVGQGNAANDSAETATDDTFVSQPLEVSSREFLASIRAGGTQQVRQALERHPKLIRSRDASGISPLLLAIYTEQPEILEILRHHEAAQLTLCEAAAVGDLERLGDLLRQDPSAHRDTTPDGATALGLAAFYGQEDAVDHLLEAGAAVNQVSDDLHRASPLHRAVSQRDAATALRLATRLLDAGADATARQAGGFTPLHQAASRGRGELADLLLRHGAQLDAESDQGLTAAGLATQRGHEVPQLG